MDAPSRRLQSLARQLAPVPQCLNTSVGLEHHPTAAAVPTHPSCCPGMFAGKVVMITGAGKGIGEAAALMFAQHGASLVLSDLDASSLDQVSAAACRHGAKVATVTGDITAADAAQRLVAAAQQNFGRLDVLVNNAGYTWDGVIHKMSNKQWQAMLDVHMSAPFKLIQAAAPLMREAAKREMDAQGSAAPRAIINISSVSGTHGNGGQANYSAAKAGVVGLTKTVAKEWGHFNIRCNAIAYGWIDTRLTRPKEGNEAITIGGEKVTLGIPGGDGLRDLAMTTVPLGRMGTAEEAAGAILMLASPWSTYITGQVLEVNGGSYM